MTTVHPVRSWCPECEGFLMGGGDHFDGRLCGTCHTETLAARWEVQPDGTGCFVVYARGYVHHIEAKIRFRSSEED